MNENLRKRRTKALRMHFDGTENWAKKLAGEFGVSESAVREDWRKRDSWIEKLERPILNEALSVCRENLAEMVEVRKEAWKFYQQTNNDNAGLGALRLIEKASRNHIKLLQSLGELQRELGTLKADTSKEDLISVNIAQMEEEEEAEDEKE